MSIHKILLPTGDSISIASVTLQKLSRILRTPAKAVRPKRVGDELMTLSDEECEAMFKVRPKNQREGGDNFAERMADWRADIEYDAGCLSVGAGRYEFQKSSPEEYKIECEALEKYLADENLPPMVNAQDWRARGDEIVSLLREYGMEYAGTEFWGAVSAFNELSGGTSESEVAQMIEAFRSRNRREAAGENVSEGAKAPGEQAPSPELQDEPVVSDDVSGKVDGTKPKRVRRTA